MDEVTRVLDDWPARVRVNPKEAFVQATCARIRGARDENPGKWVRVAVYSHAPSARTAKATYMSKFDDDPALELRSRTIEGVHGLWARWTPTPERN